MSREDIRKASRDDEELGLTLAQAIHIVWANQDLGPTTKQNITDELRKASWELENGTE